VVNKIDSAFLTSYAYRRLLELRKEILSIIGDLPVRVSYKNRREDIKDLDSLYEIIWEAGIHGVEIQRYKGLGEMNPEQLWETTMNPKTRRLMQVTLEDAALADEVFSILMGDKVEPRKEFIMKYAKEVKNLDV